jgi:hypothetical protein
MSEHMWGVTQLKPSRSQAERFDRICRECGGYGFSEINLNDKLGAYKGWFSGPNRGHPFDRLMENNVEAAIKKAKGQ